MYVRCWAQKLCSAQFARTVFVLFSEGEREFTFDICCRASICCLSVMLVHPTQLVEIFGKFSAMFLRHLVPWSCVDINGKFYRDRPRGTPPSGELNVRGVAKYSTFGPIEG